MGTPPPEVLLGTLSCRRRTPALLEYAVRQRAEPQLIDALQSLPREYASVDEVVESCCGTAKTA